MRAKTNASSTFHGRTRGWSTSIEHKKTLSAKQRHRSGISWYSLVLTLHLLLAGTGSAATYTVTSFTGAAVQETIVRAHGAGSHNAVLLPAGRYTVTAPIIVPCDNSLTITGPAATSAKAVLAASYTGNPIFKLSSCNGITIQYLQFANTGGMYFAKTNHTNVNITHNEFTGLPSTVNGSGISDGAIYIDGDINTTLTNFVATWNVFGDAHSCNAVFSTVVDEGGNCVGIHAQPGTAVNNTIEHNVFYHVEEGVHYVQLIDGSAPAGSHESVTQNLQIRFNYFLNWHRIAIEVQTGLINVGQQVSDNVLASPINPSYGTMFISVPCCTGGRTYLTSSVPYPASLTENNLLWTATHQVVGPFWAPVIGIEFAGGAGSRANGNFVMGDFSNQINWGHGVKPWYVEKNYLCAPHNQEYVTQELLGVSPIIRDNTEVGKCQQQVSTASKISLPSGAYPSPQKITLSNSGRNTSIYYTTDGSTPVPGSRTTKLYTAPFALAMPATVKTVGMWGVPPQPISYAAPYGFVPSAVATATYKTLNDVVLVQVVVTAAGAVHSLVTGSTIQMTAICTYSDGLTTHCNSKDVRGNFVSAWNTSSVAVAIGAGGLAKAITPGYAHITASIAGTRTLPWLLQVVPPSPPKLTRVYLTTAHNVDTVPIGGTLQFSAYAVYADGSVKLLPDDQGDRVLLWNTSNHAIAKISSMGHFTALSKGTVNVAAYLRSAAVACTITVTAPRRSSSISRSTKAAMQTADGATPVSIVPSQVPRGPGAPVEDLFNGPLWSLVAPAGGSASISQGHLFLGVPGGSNHDPFATQNHSVRVLQPLRGQDFDASMKIDSLIFPGDPGTSQGLILEGDGRNFITFAVESDSSGPALSVHTVTDGMDSLVIHNEAPTPFHDPIYLRLVRAGTNYRAFYSMDGENWMEAATFDHSLNAKAIGPFAANHSDPETDAVPVVMSIASFNFQ